MKARVNLTTKNGEDEMALWFLAFIRRKQAVGGWLLTFFLQLFWLEIKLMIGIPAMLIAQGYGGDRIPAIMAGEIQLNMAFAALSSLGVSGMVDVLVVNGPISLLDGLGWTIVVDVGTSLFAGEGILATPSWTEASLRGTS
jgi:hypothetical protein